MRENKPENPWLTIPAADYEDHMNSPNVDQLRFLNDIFKEFLSKYHPKRMLVAGCATGNGFEHIDFSIIRRVVALDINPEYLDILRQRYSKYMNKIEIICNDINACKFRPQSFDLIHCALLFEYVDPAETIRSIAQWLSRNGFLTVVLQLPDKNLKQVSETEFNSLKQLDKIMRLVDSHEFNIIISANKLIKITEETKQLKSGKKFYTAVYAHGS